MFCQCIVYVSGGMAGLWQVFRDNDHQIIKVYYCWQAQQTQKFAIMVCVIIGTELTANPTIKNHIWLLYCFKPKSGLK